MKALVTGANGAVGTHMTRELGARDWDVTAVDIASGGDCLELFRDLDAPRYDLVVHLAALIGGRAGIDGVNLNFAKDLQMDAAAIEWAVRTRQKRFLAFSSSAAYPVYMQTKHMHRPLREDDLNLDIGQPDSDYGWTKCVLERLVATARANGLPCTVVRPFSGYSHEQSTDYPFMAIVNRARQGDLSVFGPLGQLRDFVHLDDVVLAALAVVESGDNRPVNICTGRPVEFGELARMIFGAANPDYVPVPQVDYLEYKPTGVFARVGDPSRLLEHYTPKISLEEGIQRALNSQ